MDVPSGPSDRTRPRQRRVVARRFAVLLALSGVGLSAARGQTEGPGQRAEEAPPGQPAREETDSSREAEAPGRKVSPLEPVVEKAARAQKPSRSVLRAIRDALSGDVARERRGERALRGAGLAVASQLRYWIHRVRFEADRIESLLRDIARRHGDAGGRAPGWSRDIPVGDFFHRKLLEARRLAQRGDYRRARQIAEALLALDSESPVAWELRRVARQSRQRMALEELEPRLDVASLYHEVGEDPEVTFSLINRSRGPALITLEKGVLGKLRVTVTQRSVDGSATKRVESMILRARPRKDQLVLESGETWMQDVSLKPLALGKSLGIAGAVARVEITGKFRPTRWVLDGKTDENIALDVAPVELWIVPPGHRSGLESPDKRLVTALFFGQLESFLVAGQLGVWAGKSDAVLNEKVVEVLVENLDELDAVRSKLALGFLREATGKGYRQKEEWKKWWRTFQVSKPPDVR